MSRERKDMEDFLREKLDGLEHDYQTDWPEFEEKLERALFFNRMKVGAVVSAVLILISIGIFGTSAFVDGTPEEAASTEQNPVEAVQNLLDSEYFGIETMRPNLWEETGQTKVPSTQGLVVTGPVQNTQGDGISGFQGGGENIFPLISPRSRSQVKPNGESSDQSRAESHDGQVAAQTRLRQEPVEVSKAGYRQGASDSQNKVGAGSGLENPLDIQSESLTASMDLGSLSLDEVLKKGKSIESDVRPVFSPAKIKVSTEPYISPLQEQNPWSVAVSVYPNFTFRKFKVDQERLAFIHRDFIDATQAAERGGFSLNIGLRVSRRIGPITYLNSGVEYINYKTQAEFDFTHFRDANINETTGEITNYRMRSDPQRISFTGTNLYHYLNIPLSISHRPWATDHIRLNIEAGGSFMYFLTASGQSINYRTLEIMDISEREYRNRIGSFSVKVGATYHISPKFNFGLEPTLMYFTNTIYTEKYPFRVIPYSVGVNLKLQMKLN